MARLLSPAGWFASTIASSRMMSAAGATATVYVDSSRSTLADIASYDGTNTPGASIAGSVLTVDSNSALPRFWLPDGASSVWVLVGGGPRLEVAADPTARQDAVEAAWVDYSSSFAITATTTNPTKGNSTYTARYKQVGKTVHYSFYVAIGSTFVAGSGPYQFSLPVPAVTSVYACGAAYMLDASVAHHAGTFALISSSQGSIYRDGQGAELGSSGPGNAWKAGDTIKVSVTYEAA